MSKVVNTRTRKAGTYKNEPVPKSKYTKADRRPWVEPLGLLLALQRLCDELQLVFYGGDVERVSTRAGLNSNAVYEWCAQYWAQHCPEAFTRYFNMKQRELTGKDIADRVYNQWYKRKKNGWKQTGVHSGEHKKLSWR